jgi:hypothetical protein
MWTPTLTFRTIFPAFYFIFGAHIERVSRVSAPLDAWLSRKGALRGGSKDLAWRLRVCAPMNPYKPQLHLSTQFLFLEFQMFVGMLTWHSSVPSYSYRRFLVSSRADGMLVLTPRACKNDQNSLDFAFLCDISAQEGRKGCH